jgi:lipopolysaccharide export system permease protein
MNVSVTLSRYLARSYVFNTLFLLLALLSVIYLFDTVELIRRASKNDDVPFSLVLQMGLLKLPEVGQLLFPFAILFSAMYTYWQLNRRSELLVLRSSGFSVWQFLMPIIGVAVAVGIIQIAIVNPLGALLIGKYEQLEGRYLENQDSQIAIFREGLWLRQTLDGQVIGQSEEQAEKGYVIIHARHITQPGWVLKDLSVFYFGANDTPQKRLDAEQAELTPGKWVFENVKIHEQNGTAQSQARNVLPTRLSIADIEESFSSPQSMSFWQLPQHIQTLEDTGFDASRLKVYYQNLLAQPLFLASMVLLAATVSMRPPRFGGTMGLITAGVFMGFFVFFMSSYLQALGSSQQIPPFLAAWSPSLVCILLGLSVIMTLEDG